MSSDITFIIHGNYDETHLQMCDELKRFGKIILSTNRRYIDLVRKNVHVYDKVLLDIDDVDIKNIYNHQNIYYHVRSTLAGLNSCDTKYVVKLRANQFYSNIQYLVDQVTSDANDKLVCSNITINEDCPYHICDNIMAGTKNTMINTFFTAYLNIICDDFVYEGIDMTRGAEVLLCVSYLKYKKIPIVSNGRVLSYIDFSRNNKYTEIRMTDSYDNIIRNNIKVIDVNQMKPHIIRFNTASIPHSFDIKSVDDWLNNKTWMSVFK